jgi:hypothetical protein
VNGVIQLATRLLTRAVIIVPEPYFPLTFPRHPTVCHNSFVAKIIITALPIAKHDYCLLGLTQSC